MLRPTSEGGWSCEASLKREDVCFSWFVLGFDLFPVVGVFGGRGGQRRLKW